MLKHNDKVIRTTRGTNYVEKDVHDVKMYPAITYNFHWDYWKSEKDESLKDLKPGSTNKQFTASDIRIVDCGERISALRQIIADLVDFDLGDLTNPVPMQVNRHEAAWKAAIEEVGPRDQERFMGDLP